MDEMNDSSIRDNDTDRSENTLLYFQQLKIQCTNHFNGQWDKYKWGEQIWQLLKVHHVIFFTVMCRANYKWHSENMAVFLI